MLVAAVASTLPKSTSMFKNQGGKQRVLQCQKLLVMNRNILISCLIFARISVKSVGALNESSIWPAVISCLVLPAPLH